MLVLNLIGLALIFFVVWWFWLYKSENKTESNVEDLVVIVSDGIYSPTSIKLEAGRSQIIQFLRKDATPCAETIIFPEIEVSEELPLGKTISIVIPPLDVGQYKFHCPMQMYKGTLVVE